MKYVSQILIVLGILVVSGPALADKDAGQASSAYPAVQLAGVLDAVSEKSGRVFLADHRVQADVVVGQLKTKDITYKSLLIILHNNGLASVSVGDVTNIIPAPIVRTYALPVIHEDDDSIAEYEWVSRVVEIKNGPATRFVPILRPLLPQMAHLVADAGSNSLIIAGRYGNTKRLIAIIKELDQRTSPQP